MGTECKYLIDLICKIAKYVSLIYTFISIALGFVSNSYNGS